MRELDSVLQIRLSSMLRRRLSDAAAEDGVHVSTLLRGLIVAWLDLRTQED